MIDQEEIKKMSIFQPFATRELFAAMGNQQRFVHYTSARVGLSILQNKEIWMRRISCMSDFREVRHGLECLTNAWNSDAGETLKNFLSHNFPGVVDEIIELFGGWQFNMENDTYITCLSKHYDNEDMLGRLSMWRAYGGRSGVALVIKGTPFFRTENEVNLFSTPVAYLSREDFQKEFEIVVHSIISNSPTVLKMDREEVKEFTFHFLHLAALSSKHPGFKEEDEWRIIYAPKMFPSDFLKKSTEVVNEEPQTVYKIPLQNNPKLNVDWIDLNDILDRVIIGPTQNAYAAYAAFVEVMEEAGVENAADKVFYSDIPLRR